ncbi:MAG: hypothetical protein CME26_15240 [Gemmatimonadetes bacterium]|nr:hypothetical protein [Gemmatimonadota bacterium]|tara:strand:- start:13742 stop:14323 length:582 start_codon:yes stop_codon:yes gene_type:complete
MADTDLTPAQQAMMDTLAEHAKAELGDRDLDGTLSTMTNNPYILFVSSLTGGDDRAGVREFYRELMDQLPDDLKLNPIARTIGSDRVVGECILTFTHSVSMDWLLPGLPPTGRKVAIPLVVVFTFENGMLASERAYWDQASLLQQLGLLERGGLPIAGIQGAEKLRQLTGAKIYPLWSKKTRFLQSSIWSHFP